MYRRRRVLVASLVLDRRPIGQRAGHGLGLVVAIVVVVQALVQRVELGRLLALEIVPPIADEVTLVEYAAARAEEGAFVALGVAHVEHLRTREIRQSFRVCFFFNIVNVSVCYYGRNLIK